MTTPMIPQKAPYIVNETKGKKAWCACGMSEKQPYCDGSHKMSGMSPIIVEIEADKKVAWCGCKNSRTKPFCDGSHNKLP